jgi:hypothetical protein
VFATDRAGSALCVNLTLPGASVQSIACSTRLTSALTSAASNTPRAIRAADEAHLADIAVARSA